MNPIPIVGVGSIQHILKTAFVSVYDEEKSIQDAKNEKKEQKIREQEEKAAAIQLAVELEEAEKLNEKKTPKKPEKRSSQKVVEIEEMTTKKDESSIVDENLGTLYCLLIP